MERNLPRIDIIRTPLGEKIKEATQLSEQRIMRAAVQLEELEITEAEIRDLVEVRIKQRLDFCQGDSRRGENR